MTKSIARWATGFSTMVLLAAVTIPSTSHADYRSFKPTAEKPYYFEDGKVDFGTYNGFRRYHADCHVCHGPAGLGSSYAPALMESMKTMDWMSFVDVIVRGREGTDNKVMPPFAGNTDVLANMLDIYAYLRARADDVIGPVRPAKFPKIKKP